MKRQEDGQITINGETQKIKYLHFKKLDKTETATVTEQIKKIAIKSSFGNVSVSSSAKVSKIEAHLFSEGTFAGNVQLNIKQISNELFITASFSGICNGGALKLEVLIPEEHFYKEISINS